MADPRPGGIRYNSRWSKGHLERIDELGPMDQALGTAISTYTKEMDTNKQSHHWARTLNFVENILFSSGRHYIDGILATRLHNSSATSVGDISEVRDTISNVPRPTNDLLGRYIETNIALLTENRPMPRVTPKSDSSMDKTAAQVSELIIQYLWEALGMPDKHRELARIVLHCGVCFIEIYNSPLAIRSMRVPETTKAPAPAQLPGGREISTPVERTTPKLDKDGNVVYNDKLEYGDLVAKLVSPFELYFPIVHYWDDITWVVKEEYMPLDTFKDTYLGDKTAKGIIKKNGWNTDNVTQVRGENIRNLPLWWWERLSHLIEGAGPTLNVGTPDQWDDYVTIRTLDRKPNEKWPRGRTVIVAGDKVIYDSPKKIGARAFDPRWPDRWHPYIRYRWEGMVGNIYARSLVTKLLPMLKRINAIDTAIIMWRRTVPISSWLLPKGTQVHEDIWSGGAGRLYEFDPRRTANMKPEPIFAPPFPDGILKEREMMIQQMEAISGTEEVLRGERPVGVNSASMLDVLRKQALASRSSILQAWDESYQKLGLALLQESIKSMVTDKRFMEGVHILARQKHSRFSLRDFSALNIVDNAQVRVDTASQALVSKEAREAKALEFLQYAPGLMQLPIPLRQAIVEELGFKDSLTPQGPDVERANMIISFIKTRQYGRVIPLPEDDPHVFNELLIKEVKVDSVWDLDKEQYQLLRVLIEYYTKQIQIKEQRALEMQIAMAQLMGPQKGRPPEQGKGQQ